MRADTHDGPENNLHTEGEHNTLSDVASFYLGPLSGRAQVATRIRLKKSQSIFAVAEMSDGTTYIGRARTTVLPGAGDCG